jgi:hypothetical protein
LGLGKWASRASTPGDDRRIRLMIGYSSVDCVLFATLRNFSRAVMATTLFSHWLSQFDYNRGCLHEIARR